MSGDLRQQIADELTAFADRRREAVYRHSSELDLCTRRSNDCVVNAYYVAAAMARDGNPTNPDCEQCRGTLGGPQGHTTAECGWVPCDTAADRVGAR